MPVYVDTIFRYPIERVAQAAKRHGTLWCHLYGDTEDDLDAFARLMRLPLSWKQNHARLTHYDLTPFMRSKAIRLGAIPDNDKQHMRRIMGYGPAIKG